MLRQYVDHDKGHRPRRALHQQPPAGGTAPRPAATIRPLRRDRLGGLIHEYVHEFTDQIAGMRGDNRGTQESICALFTCTRANPCSSPSRMARSTSPREHVNVSTSMPLAIASAAYWPTCAISGSV